MLLFFLHILPIAIEAKKKYKIKLFHVHMEVKKWKFMLIKKLKVRKLN